MHTTANTPAIPQTVAIPVAGTILTGELGLPDGAPGIVLFAHGSGSGRHSPRNQAVAAHLRSAGLGTLLFDLLTETEERADTVSGHLRFDIPFLADRVAGAVEWLAGQPATRGREIGLFGASTGAGAALVAAAREPGKVRAVVSRGGRPDLAGDALPAALCPTLLIVGGNDDPVIGLNEQALAELAAPVKELVIVPGAGHLFEEAGTLDEVARLAADWFTRHLGTGDCTYAN